MDIQDGQQALESINVSYRELERQDVALRQEDNRLRKEKVKGVVGVALHDSSPCIRPSCFK